MKEITSRDNTAYKQALSLHQKKYRQRTGRFLVEGQRALMTALQENIPPLELWVADSARESKESILAQVDSRTVRVVTDGLLQRLARTEEAQGIVAVFAVDSLPREVKEPVQDTIVVLDRVQDPGNAGTIVRIAAASGCQAVWTTCGSVDLFNEKAVRSTMGCLFQIPVRVDVTPDEIIAQAREEHRAVYAAALRRSLPYSQILPAERAFWVFGNEGNGITEEVLSSADGCYHIPLHNNVESLNVAMAASVILFYYRDMCLAT